MSNSPVVVIRRKAGSKPASPAKAPSKPGKPGKSQPQAKAQKKPLVQTPALKKAKLKPDAVAKAKTLIQSLAHPGLRPCYVDMLSRRAVFHKKAEDKVWLQTELSAYLRRQLKHVLHRQTEPILKGEALSKAIEKRLSSNFEKQVRKAGFNPEFSGFLFLEQFQALQELYGKECWYFLKRTCKDLKQLRPTKAAQILAAAKLIGNERLKGATDKQAFIEGSEEFKNSATAKTDLVRAFTAKTT
jgi:hypothetical protein